MEVILGHNEFLIPHHVDRELLERAIRSYEKDPNAKVLDFSITPGSNVGDNFGSRILRVKIKFNSKYRKNFEISMIIKTVEESFKVGGVENFIGFKKVFEDEAELYGKILPEVKELLNESFWPGFIYHEIEPNLVLILEDVCERGFNKIITFPSQDLEVSKMTIKKLAKFHAASFYLQNELKYDFSHFNNTYHSEDAVSELVVGKTIKGLIEFLKDKEEFEHFIPDLEHFRDNHQKMTLESYKVGKGFNVLNHADFHIKNVLWKVDGDEKIEDVCVIDFQTCFYGTPAIDLSHALYFFLSNENRKYHRDEFIAAYHTQFVDSLKSFGFLKSIPSLLDLQVELLKHGNLQAMIGLAYSIFAYSNMNSFTAEDMKDPVEVNRKMFSAKGYQEILEMDLPRFAYKGML